MMRALTSLAVVLPLLMLSGCSLWPFGERKMPSEERTLPGEEPTAQVIDPDSQRPKVAVKQIQPEDFEVGGYVGALRSPDARALGVYGVRGTYHKSEDFFVEAHYEFASTFGYNQARSLVGADEIEDIDYSNYGLSMGWNALPGDLYFGRSYTLPFQLYLVGGAGYTSYEDDNFATYSVGGGVRLLPQDWWSLRLEVRDQIWSVNGTDHNAEVTFGLAYYF